MRVTAAVVESNARRPTSNRTTATNNSARVKPRR
jgi:hypothetical protein